VLTRHCYDSSLRTARVPSLRTVGSLAGMASYGPYIDESLHFIFFSPDNILYISYNQLQFNLRSHKTTIRLTHIHPMEQDGGNYSLYVAFE
jgi:hypothetical protein